MVVLEELEHARARGAKIYAEVTGYGATSDGHDMVAPSRRRAASARCGWRSRRCRQGRKVGYINAHGTSTPVGDVSEVEAVRRVFGEGSDAADQLDQVDDRPQPGRDRGAGGDLLPADAARRLHRRPRSTSRRSTRRSGPARSRPTRVDDAGLDTVMTNSFGFGGTNASLLLSRL